MVWLTSVNPCPSLPPRPKYRGARSRQPRGGSAAGRGGSGGCSCRRSGAPASWSACHSPACSQSPAPSPVPEGQSLPSRGGGPPQAPPHCCPPLQPQRVPKERIQQGEPGGQKTAFVGSGTLGPSLPPGPCPSSPSPPRTRRAPPTHRQAAGDARARQPEHVVGGGGGLGVWGQAGFPDPHPHSEQVLGLLQRAEGPGQRLGSQTLSLWGGLWEPPPSSWMSEVPLQNIKLWKTFPSVSLSQALIHTVYSVISLGPSVTYPQR